MASKHVQLRYDRIRTGSVSATRFEAAERKAISLLLVRGLAIYFFLDQKNGIHLVWSVTRNRPLSNSELRFKAEASQSTGATLYMYS